MPYIIYDLEFTVSRNTRYSSEIIDIGAVKVTEGEHGLFVSDSFHTYVRPSNKSVLSADTIQFTGITQKDIDAAPLFPEALNQFIAWMGSESYYMCSWGPDDRTKLISHCRTHQLDVAWITNHNDLQQQWSRTVRKEGKFRQFGLAQALELCGIEFDGTQHRALDDAINTAKVFMHQFDQFKLETNCAADDEGITSKVVYSSNTEDDDKDSPFGNLAHLFKTKE
ncbi:MULTISPECIES: 3'-5' exonuclease [unclassified Paenibacillus]|uniref:3'-5' exonuclease n=1 Tax=unclassified Paenibacillus TaxID=185978 RepID=UPI0008D034BB|nr:MULTISPECIES: 3'-5' exonuclease [unclassified Paenibacillus]QLG42322.1 exonuclease domain-containing protein [Paenibacillus sp. E222]SEM84360.1 Inhibitor of the KinA pathway to sporulation, predicted exonuclease [Paenibacillus sp. OK076]